MRYLGIPYKNEELGLHYLPEQIVRTSHSCLLINIDMWGRIVLICSNFNLKQVCGGGCSFSSPQIFWLVQLLKVVMSCHDLIDRDQFSRQTLKKNKKQKNFLGRGMWWTCSWWLFSCEKNLIKQPRVYMLSSVRQLYLLFYSFCPKKIWKGQQKLE